jgi:hypothetical protein
MDHLGEFVNEDNDGVVATGCGWKVGNEIEGDGFPAFVGNLKGLKESGRKLVGRLVLLA